LSEAANRVVVVVVVVDNGTTTLQSVDGATTCGDGVRKADAEDTRPNSKRVSISSDGRRIFVMIAMVAADISF
jgi:hypothetical protein